MLLTCLSEQGKPIYIERIRKLGSPKWLSEKRRFAKRLKMRGVCNSLCEKMMVILIPSKP